MKAFLISACAFLWSAFFRPAIGSVHGSLIVPELKKAALASIGASSAVGVSIAFVNAIIPDVPTLLTSPAAASLVTLLLVQLVGVLGQLGQSHTGASHPSLLAFAERLGYREEFENQIQVSKRR